MSITPLTTLVLAGTAEARAVIDGLKNDPAIALTASLAGATPQPIALPVPTLSGGFGGEEGLVAYCREHGIGMMIDATHPFARQISRNARAAAAILDIPCLRFERPPWTAAQGDDWRSFDSWEDMADAIPPGMRVFLAGGTRSIEIFSRRDDITLWARALNVEGRDGPPNVTFINAMPQADMADERATFHGNGVELLCCKNSGGEASFAKILAARDLGLPVWMLRRHSPDPAARKQMEKMQIHDNVEDLILAARQIARQIARQRNRQRNRQPTGQTTETHAASASTIAGQ